jgi:hypothetical protein
VYEGTISSSTPHSVAITGGNATVPGTYTLVGSLYLVSSGVLLAQTQETVLIADPCPTPTPVPPPPSGTPQPEAPADIRWSQSAMPSRGAATGTILKITVRAHNIGRGAGRSDAILTYDPQFLRLLDAQPQRDSDWIRARDDQRGSLTVAAGLLHPNDQGRWCGWFAMMVAIGPILCF